MRTFDRLHINESPNPDGSRNVSGLIYGDDWHPAGRLQPEIKNHVKEQPTNKWKQRLIDAQRKAAQS